MVTVFGILNLTEDSFFDESRRLDPAGAVTAAIEMLRRIDTLIVDKTGTLTQGKPAFHSVQASVGHTLEQVLQMAASLDQGSEHPLAEAIVAQARSVLDWHRRHGFCAACGSPTRLDRAGYSRLCEGCGAEHFPRVDPVVIMLAEKDGKAVLAAGAHMLGTAHASEAVALRDAGLEQVVANRLGRR